MGTADTSESNANASTDASAARIRALGIFFLGFGAYALIGGGLHMGQYLIDNLTTYIITGGMLFVVGLLLLTVAR